MNSRFSFASAGASHLGHVRSVNEDAWVARPDLGLWAVADGMGGHHRGDWASGMVAEALAELPPPGDARGLRQAVEEAIGGINGRLRREVGPGEVCGTTVVALLVHGRHFAVLWAGDSRVYRAADGGLACLTRDHSLVQEMVDRGEITAEAMRGHPLGNHITRAVGADDELVLDAVQGEITPGDTFLLCSDGLTKHLDDDEIAALIDRASPEGTARALLATALDRGGSDNVTVLVVTAQQPDPETTHPPRP
jgi:serine/threonine protein phosphatase PrpC